MSVLRELIVNVDFKGMDINKLDRLDHKVDDIEHSLHAMDGEIDESTRDFAKMGVVGGSALEHIDNKADKATRSLRKLNHEMNGMNHGGDGWRDPFLNISGGAWLAMAPALHSLVGVAAAGAGGLAAGFTAAGISAVSFGAVAIPIIKRITDSEDKAVKLQEKIRKADTAEERIKAQKELADLYKNMSQEQRDALKNLREFKQEFNKLEQDMEKPTLKVFADGLKAANDLLIKLEPTIKNTATAVDDLIGDFRTNLNSADMQDFFTWLGSDGANYLKQFGEAGGNFVAGFFDMMKAFGNTTGKDVANSFLEISNNFRDWASDLENNKSFQDFITNAKENLPIVKDLFGNLYDVAKQLAPTFTEFGNTSLKALRDLSDFLANDPLMKLLYRVTSGVASAINWGYDKLPDAKNYKITEQDYMNAHGGPYTGKKDILGDLAIPDPSQSDSAKRNYAGYPEADGLSYVPTDGYPIRAHRGEGLLTAAENKAYRAGKTGGRSTTATSYSPTFHIYANNKSDAEEIARVVKRENEKFWLQMTLKQA